MKKWIPTLLTVMLAGMIFWSCSDDDGRTEEPTNENPICTIASPFDNATYTIGNNITVRVDASDTDGAIAEVKFYFDDTEIGSDTSLPYSYSIPSVGYSEGIYLLKAITIDNDGAETSIQINLNLTTTVPLGMVLIPSGTFQMGDHFSEGNSDELPLHSVTVNDFYMGVMEVTNQQYCDMLNYALSNSLITASTTTVSNISGDSQELLAIDDAYCEIIYNGSTFAVEDGKENYPVPEVTWYGSVFYCNMESRQKGCIELYNLIDWSCNFAGSGYRLPTEAEWEYAARGGLSGQRFSNGNTISHSTNGDTQANYYGTTYFSYDVSPTIGYHPDYNGTSSPVGSFSANGYGLYDMSGNHMEWCWDWCDGVYSSSPSDNPTGPNSGDGRVLRDGSWGYYASGSRVANRSDGHPTFGNVDISFRVLRIP